MAENISLAIAGQLYGGWKGIELQSSIEQGATIFNLSVTEKWAGQKTHRPIVPGSPCKLLIDGAAIVDGYIDDVEADYDAASHEIRLPGRCRIGDLVDSAAVVDGDHEYLDIGLGEIAARIAKPFGVAVRAEVGLGAPFARFAIQPGETAWEAIERACRYRAVLPNGDGLGSLVLTRAGRGGRAAGALTLGENIERATGTFSYRERFSLVVVRGQQENVDGVDPEVAVSPEGRAKDPSVNRYRPTVIVAEQAGGEVSFADRAAWQVRFARGRSRSVSYTVAGWRDAGGELWRQNTLIPVVDPYLGINEELLIVSVGLTLDENGSHADLKLAPRDAYDLLPEPEPETADTSLMGVE